MISQRCPICGMVHWAGQSAVCKLRLQKQADHIEYILLQHYLQLRAKPPKETPDG